MGIFDRLRGESLKIHIIIRGRIGDANGRREAVFLLFLRAPLPR